jgi:hypothetical protein
MWFAKSAMKPTLKNLRVCGLVAVLLAVLVLPSSAEANAWDGTWKLNEMKSHLGGPAFTITILGEGEFQVVTSSYNYRLICDGKYRPMVGNKSLACLKTTATTMDTAEKENGKLLNTVHRELSADGKTLAQTMVRIDEQGSGKLTHRDFTRVSKSTGLAGVWADANGLDRQPQVMVMALVGSTLRLSFPREKQYTNAKLDGSDSPTQGIAGGARVTLSVKPEGSRKLLTVQKLNGTVLYHGTLILSSDGRNITEETWKPEAPTMKSRLVYDKQ